MHSLKMLPDFLQNYEQERRRTAKHQHSGYRDQRAEMSPVIFQQDVTVAQSRERGGGEVDSLRLHCPGYTDGASLHRIVDGRITHHSRNGHGRKTGPEHRHRLVEGTGHLKDQDHARYRSTNCCG